MVFFDLEFAGMGSKIHEMRNNYQSRLLQNMQIVKAAKSASIRINVPKISVADSLKEQKEITMKAIEEGKILLNWGIANIKL